MRTLFVLFVLVTGPMLAFGQLSLRYKACVTCNGSGTVQQMAAADVASDFGRRTGNYSQWHIGVDFSPTGANSDLGYPFMPIETGTVTTLKGEGYKQVGITGAHRFAYGHIFRNGTPGAAGMSSGDFILMRMNAPHNSYYAIIYNAGTTVFAVGLVNGTVTHPSVNGGNPIAVTNQITDANRPIAPIGNSGGDYEAHIHLYNFQNDPVGDDYGSGYPGSYNATYFRNAKNPLQFLNHNRPTYTVSFQPGALRYPGTQRSFFNVRAAMNGAAGSGNYPVVMDVDAVELFIKKKYEAFNNTQYYKGTVLESKIFYGGRLNTDRYPSNGFPAHNSGQNAIDIAKGDGVGSTTLTGISAFAYSSQPYDEYYFSDFYSRIHKDDNYGGTNARFASVSSDARYPDGEYNYFARVTTADNQVHDSQTQTLTLDNFKPYVQEVIVRKVNQSGPLVYRGFWSWNGSQLTLFKEKHADVNPVENIWIKVTMSEPMKFSVANPVAINIPTVDGSTYRPLVSVMGTDEREFTITYPAIVTTGQIAMKIIGYDYGDNYLEKMTSSPTTVPTRASASTWSGTPNPGADENHSFTISSSATCTFTPPGGRVATEACLISNFESNVRQTVPGNDVVFTSLSSGSGTLQYNWNFGVGASPATATTSGPHVIRYSSVGSKTVVLTINDASGSVTTTKTSYITVGQTLASADFSASNTSGQQPLVVTFSPTYAGTATSYAWSFPGGSPSTSSAANPVVTYTGSGSYNVSLVINNSTTVSKTGFINVGLAPTPTASFTYCDNYNFTGCNNNFKQNQAVYFFPTASGGTPLYNYYWNFGDGETSTSLDPVHSYFNAGTYTVILTVIDSKGASVTSSSSITIASITPQITANWSTSDTYITNGDGPVTFTDASTSNIDLTFAEYYWDFGDGAFPRYAYTKGPHTVCYNNIPSAKNVFLRIREPITNAYDDQYAANHIVVIANTACQTVAPAWSSPKGVPSAAAIGNSLYPNEVAGIQNGSLGVITCSSTYNNCAFNPQELCIGPPFFASHGDPSLRNDNGNCFRVYSNAYYNTDGSNGTPSEGIYYQHHENFRGGRQYIFTFWAKISGFDNARGVVDHLKISLTNGLQSYTVCQDNGSTVDYSEPAYPYSSYELGSLDYAINSYTWKPFEVYFTPPNNTFNQIWIDPVQEKSWLSQTTNNERLVWFLMKNFSLRVRDVDPLGYPCPPDVKVDNTNVAAVVGAGLTIKTMNTVSISAGQERLYRAGESVQLLPGFSAALGSKFTAKIGPCESSAGRIGEDNPEKSKEHDLYLINYQKPEEKTSRTEPAISLAESDLQLYPNPANGHITLKLNGSSGDVHLVTIIDILGTNLSTTDVIGIEHTFDLSYLPAGVYIMKVESGQRVFYKQFIKQ
ncbi:MAG: PKD domain-containing protein [Chryseolinea sp.]